MRRHFFVLIYVWYLWLFFPFLFFKVSLCGVDNNKNFLLNTVHINRYDQNNESMALNNEIKMQKKQVKQYQLANGMSLLVRESHDIPKVSLQLWYGVGSKFELDGQRGSAHFLEHMVFKGTEHMLSESDIDDVTTKLSATANAFTSHDYTGYLFNVPSQNWEQILPIFVDCMSNLSLKPDMLNSEMKAVIQELKLNKDNYVRSLIEDLVGAIFHDHPYHHPIIGYKQDLWNINAQMLRDFYKKHYHPGNATLVVVGDVDPDHVFTVVKKHFESIQAPGSYVLPVFYHNKDIATKSITIYRDVQRPILVYAFVIPGLMQKEMHVVSLIDFMIGQGKNSRLYKKLVNELHIATSVSTFVYDLYDYGLFFIIVEPENSINVSDLDNIIKQDISLIAKDGFNEEELWCALKKTKMELYDVLEDTEHQAYEIGKYFTAFRDPDFVFNALNYDSAILLKEANRIVSEYLRPAVMHKGAVLPLPDVEKERWVDLQNASDAEDNMILSARPRIMDVEAVNYGNHIKPNVPKQFNFPQPTEFVMANGMKVLFYHSNNLPKIDVWVDCAAKYYFDSKDKPGLYNFVTHLMTEGTKKYSSTALHDALESRGMSISCVPGKISLSMLSEDFIFGLEILKEVFCEATFNEAEIEKVRSKIYSHIDAYWDNPNKFFQSLVKKEIYQLHPYANDFLGTKQSVGDITRNDLVDFYTKNMTPQGTTVAIVGDLSGYNLEEIFRRIFGNWDSKKLDLIVLPDVPKTKANVITYPINRDQVVLGFAGRSVSRLDKDFDALLLFDQIFGGGVLGSMSSQLFQLRQRSGLFYGISGSFIAGADEQPGMLLVKTVVSLDRLQEAEVAIKDAIIHSLNNITEQDLQAAKNAIINSLVDNFATYSDTALSFLALNKYNFPKNYFNNRAQQLQSVTLDSVKEAVKKVLNNTELVTIRIGRLGDKENNVAVKN